MSVYLQDTDVTVHCGDVLDVLPTLPEDSVDCVVTSPPYWGLRDYGTGEWDGGDPECDHSTPRSRGEDIREGDKQGTNAGSRPNTATVCRCGARRIDHQVGLEQSFDEFVDALVRVFREVRRVLAPNGTCWLNLGDSYAANRTYQVTDSKHRDVGNNSASSVPAGLKPKDLLGQPWAVAFALRADGWYLRSCVIWAKPNPMPESVTDRPTTSHEYVFLLAKGQWKARVVSLTNLDGNRVHLGDDLRPENANTWANEFAVRFATSILDSSELQNQLGLSPLDPEVRQKLADSGDSLGVAGLPVEHRAAVYAARLLTANATPKEFLCQLDGLGIALSENNKFLVLGGTTEFALPPGVDRYGETAVAIHHPGQIGELDFSAHTLKFSRPGGCSYFYDAEAVREPYQDPREGGDGFRWNSSHYTNQDGPFPNSGRGPDGRRKTTVQAADGSIQHRDGERWPNPAGRNLRSVWTIPTQPYPEAHFATYPEELVRRCLLAGCPERVCRTCGKPSEREYEVTRRYIVSEGGSHADGTYRVRYSDEPHDVNFQERGGDSLSYNKQRWHNSTRCTGMSDCGHNDYRPGIVLDPFLGSGTTAHVARKHGRKCIGVELNPAYCELASKRLAQQSLLAEPAA